MVFFRAVELQVELVRPEAVAARGDPQGHGAIRAGDAAEAAVGCVVEDVHRQIGLTLRLAGLHANGHLAVDGGW